MKQMKIIKNILECTIRKILVGREIEPVESYIFLMDSVYVEKYKSIYWTCLNDDET